MRSTSSTTTATAQSCHMVGVSSEVTSMTIDPKKGNELLAKLLKARPLPIVQEPEPEPAEVDYEALAIEIWGHWPGPLDEQQQHDLLVEARARGLA